jgi:hypothetical protein
MKHNTFQNKIFNCCIILTTNHLQTNKNHLQTKHPQTNNYIFKLTKKHPQTNKKTSSNTQIN